MACGSHRQRRSLKTAEMLPDFRIFRPPAFLGSLCNASNPRPPELAFPPLTGACDGSRIHRDRRYAVFPAVNRGMGARSFLS